jgi:hypothetical protein
MSGHRLLNWGHLGLPAASSTLGEGCSGERPRDLVKNSGTFRLRNQSWLSCLRF